MFRVRSLAVVVALVGVGTVTAGPPAPTVYTADPPAEIKTLLTRLKERDGPTAAIKALATRDDAAPYLRLELQTTTNNIVKQYLLDALAPIEARAYGRNKNRYARWAETGRIDLCAELLVACPEKDDAPGLADRTLPLRKMMVDRWSEAVDPYPPGYSGFKRTFWGPEFNLHRDHAHETGADITLPPRAGWRVSLVRAERCTTQAWARHSWFVSARSELVDELMKKAKERGGHSEWHNSVVLVNNSAKLPRVSESLIVCDGDIELVSSVDSSVVVANGSIRSEKWTAGSRAYLCATGDIVLPAEAEGGKSVFHAGGTVTFANMPKASDRVWERQKALPFGIRFLDVGEFGLELAAQNGGVQVLGIAPDSPFARYGVEDGDVITSIDDVSATSIPTFRRQLRRGVVAESVFLRILRGNQRITRMVFLDGVPLPTAPPPR